MQNFIENFARYQEVRNYQLKQGFHLAGVGFGILAGPGVIMPFARLIGQNIQAGHRVNVGQTEKIARQKAEVVLTPEAIAAAPEDTKSREKLTKLGVKITADGRGVDVSKARVVDTTIMGDTTKIVLDPKTNIYTPKNPNERITTIVQVTRDSTGAETSHLMIMAVPATTTTTQHIEEIHAAKSETIEANKLSVDEIARLKDLLTVGKIPDTLPGDTLKFRNKYPEMEKSNDKDSKMDLKTLQGVITRMRNDGPLQKILK